MLRTILAAWILTAFALVAQTVEGRVVNSVTGAGIPAVTVNLRQGPKNAYSATTDSQGRFRIEDVKSGVYTANYRASGYWPPPPFQVTAGSESVSLEGKMQPAGKISGRVLDAAGKPVPNASVRWHWERGNAIVSSTSKAGEKGEYSLNNLDLPGPWVLSATAPPSWPLPETRDDERLAWVQTFYPGVTDRQLAAQVVVPPGSELRLDIELAAVPVHRVRGVVLNVRGDPEPTAKVTLGKDSTSLILRQDTRDDGTFEFESVADDDWGLFTKLDKDGVKLWAAERCA